MRDKRYWSKAWKELRLIAILRDNNMCCICNKFVTNSKKTGRGAHVDHIIEVRDGGDFFDLNNLQTLCPSCHSKKTNSHGKGEIPLIKDFDKREEILKNRRK